MKNLLSIYKYFFFITIVISLLFAFNVFSVWKVNPSDSKDFSAVRVSEDIYEISKEHHSIEHPVERAKVKNYLFSRLNQMGGDPQLFNYDSIVNKFGGYFDISNVYGCFEPLVKDNNTKYVMLVAHYDSRYHNIVRGDTVYSYGAADDGYGLGVILESVNIALKYRPQWNQGVKVLFTDSEEHELDGMYNAVTNNYELFDNVNFVINIEARGVKGDALLFETSKNNASIMELYSNAKYKRGFSLTSFVYNILPNFTDFNHVKDSIPGVNFAVIDNLHYYHTDKDNFDNISLSSIQHYGEQISPILKEYLINPSFANAGALNSKQDTIYFGIPLLGMYIFKYWQYLVFNILTYLIVIILLIKLYISFRITFISTLKFAGNIFLFSLMSLICGVAISYLICLCTGQKFDPINLKYFELDYLVAIITFVIYSILIWIYVMRFNKKGTYYFSNVLSGTLLSLLIVSLILFIAIKENFFVLVPLFVTSLALLLSFVFSRRFLVLIALFISTLVSSYFIYSLYIAITIGSLGVLLFFATFTLFLIVSLYNYYNYSYNRSFI